MNFEQTCKAIKEVKIQGAENVAIATIKAYHMNPTNSAIRKLVSLRPTEPCLRNALNFVKKDTKNISKALVHFEKSKELIAEYGSRLIKDNSILFTHCHSGTVINVFKKAKQEKKKFVVRNTETRPLFQGRITSLDLLKLKIPNTQFIDSAMRQAIKKCDAVFLGADAIDSSGKIYNKIGSELVCETAERFGVPVYICTNSWKFDPESIYGAEEKIELRSREEVWPKAPKQITIMNPAFEKINPNLITAIISELGVYKPESFIYEVQRAYPWMFKK
ncbi:MAG: translation initiation factor eIF-2B [Candidatus Nanoarchaeia archaeon]